MSPGQAASDYLDLLAVLRLAVFAFLANFAFLAGFLAFVAFLAVFFGAGLRAVFLVAFLAVFFRAGLRAVFLVAFLAVFFRTGLRAVFLVAFLAVFFRAGLRAVFLVAFLAVFFRTGLRAVFLVAFLAVFLVVFLAFVALRAFVAFFVRALADEAGFLREVVFLRALAVFLRATFTMAIIPCSFQTNAWTRESSTHRIHQIAHNIVYVQNFFSRIFIIFFAGTNSTFDLRITFASYDSIRSSHRESSA